jgi:hypothetical protein
MSGAMAPHAGYNGTGTQGLAVTNKINDPAETNDLVSVFWNQDKTTKQLLHGVSILELPSSATNQVPGSSITFTLNSDADAIGEIYATVKLTTTGGDIIIKKENALQHIINKIEFQSGTTVWETIEAADIIALNTTELDEGAYYKYSRSVTGFDNVNGNIRNYGDVVSKTGIRQHYFSFRLPLFNRKVSPLIPNYSNISEKCFLTVGAGSTCKIKIFTNTLAMMQSEKFIDLNGTAISTGQYDMRLYAKHYIMCNEERNRIKQMPEGLSQRIKLTQNVTKIVDITGSTTDDVTTNIIDLDCDTFSLYASHLIIQLFDDSTLPPLTVAGKEESQNDANTSGSSLFNAELKLNSTSFSGLVPGSLLCGPSHNTLGLYCNSFYHQNSVNARTFTYVFPLGSQAFSGSSVPLNRFDSIRLALRCVIPKRAAGDGGAIKLRKISVTCVGESTTTYKNNTASISMY